MKTKALLLAGMVFAAGAVSSMAQGTVYSVNAVGFVNVVLPPGFSLICNPLNASVNTVPALFPNATFGMAVFKFSAGGGFIANTFGFGGWTDPAMTLVPGEGFFFKNPGATVTNTFVGNVQQGTLTTQLSAGFQLVSSQVPQSGFVSTDLGAPVAQFESVFTYNQATGYSSYTIGFGGGWSPSEPIMGVGQAFFLKKNVGGVNWTRVFNVNQ